MQIMKKILIGMMWATSIFVAQGDVKARVRITVEDAQKLSNDEFLKKVAPAVPEVVMVKDKKKLQQMTNSVLIVKHDVSTPSTLSDDEFAARITGVIYDQLRTSPYFIEQVEKLSGKQCDKHTVIATALRYCPRLTSSLLLHVSSPRWQQPLTKALSAKFSRKQYMRGQNTPADLAELQDLNVDEAREHLVSSWYKLAGQCTDQAERDRLVKNFEIADEGIFKLASTSWGLYQYAKKDIYAKHIVDRAKLVDFEINVKNPSLDDKTKYAAMRLSMMTDGKYHPQDMYAAIKKLEPDFEKVIVDELCSTGIGKAAMVIKGAPTILKHAAKDHSHLNIGLVNGIQKLALIYLQARQQANYPAQKYGYRAKKVFANHMVYVVDAHPVATQGIDSFTKLNFTLQNKGAVITVPAVRVAENSNTAEKPNASVVQQQVSQPTQSSDDRQKQESTEHSKRDQIRTLIQNGAHIGAGVKIEKRAHDHDASNRISIDDGIFTDDLRSFVRTR